MSTGEGRGRGRGRSHGHGHGHGHGHEHADAHAHAHHGAYNGYSADGSPSAPYARGGSRVASGPSEGGWAHARGAARGRGSPSPARGRGGSPGGRGGGQRGRGGSPAGRGGWTEGGRGAHHTHGDRFDADGSPGGGSSRGRRGRGNHTRGLWREDRGHEGRGRGGGRSDGSAHGQRSAGRQYFEAHVSEDAAMDGVRRGQYLLAHLRVNARKRSEAYGVVAGLHVDVLIDGERSRNRAMEGDLVVISLLPRDQWVAIKGSGAPGAPDVDADTAEGEALEDTAAAAHEDDEAEDELVDDDAADEDYEAEAGGEEDGEDDEEHAAEEDVDAEAEETHAAGDDVGASGGETGLEAASAAETAYAGSNNPADADADALASRLAAMAVTPPRSATAAVDSAVTSRPDHDVADDVEALGPAAAASLSTKLWQPAVRVEMSPTAVPMPVADDAGRVGAAQASSASPLAGVAATNRGIPSGWVTATQSPAYLATVAAFATLIRADGRRPVGQVHAIVVRGHLRTVIGTLRPADDKADLHLPVSDHHAFVRLIPLDVKIPYVMIPRHQAPKEFLECPADFEQRLFEASIDRWGTQGRFPIGNLKAAIGEAGEIASETRAFLAASGVRDEPFSPAVMSVLEDFESIITPEGVRLPWRIPPSELAARRDLRAYRIMTIDPWNAKDLDDALHIIPLGDDVYEVGVHIADVSFFLRPDTALDEEASRRATSVYLVQRVIPMLPPLLCEQLCSLNPGVDRLAFSCIWRMRSNGELTEDAPWFGRTVIRSVAKLDYGTAQRCIDGTISEDAAAAPDSISEALWARDRRPGFAALAAGSEDLGVHHSCLDVWHDIRLMARIALERRKKRFAAGALALNKVKLTFKMDASGNPESVSPYALRDSNRVVEEYMLLANYLVAQKLVQTVGDRAVMRCHPPIMADKTRNVVTLAEQLGLSFSVKTAADIHNSLLAAYQRDPVAGRVLEYLVTKPMKPAAYFVAGRQDRSTWGHYALAIWAYTHFTSPIRRYADVMVHRMLAEALGYARYPSHTVDALAAQCDVCNERKMESKKVQDRSDRVYLAVYVHTRPTELDAIVCDVGGSSYFTVIVPAWDIEVRIYLDRCGWKGEFNETRRELHVTPAAPKRDAATPATAMSDRKARDMVSWAHRNPEAASKLREAATPEGALFRSAEARILGGDDGAPAAASLAPTPASPGAAAIQPEPAAPAAVTSAGFQPARLPDGRLLQVDASAFVLPAEGAVVRAMTRMRVRVVADMKRLPIDVDVQILGLG